MAAIATASKAICATKLRFCAALSLCTHRRSCHCHNFVIARARIRFRMLERASVFLTGSAVVGKFSALVHGKARFANWVSACELFGIFSVPLVERNDAVTICEYNHLPDKSLCFNHNIWASILIVFIKTVAAKRLFPDFQINYHCIFLRLQQRHQVNLITMMRWFYLCRNNSAIPPFPCRLRSHKCRLRKAYWLFGFGHSKIEPNISSRCALRLIYGAGSLWNGERRINIWHKNWKNQFHG